MRKVLVVDDETSITDGLTALLQLEQIDASGAYDRESAELAISRDFYPVILADLRLHTEEDGFRLIESIRRVSPRSRIASLTAFATPEVEERLLELGSSTVLRKPMEFDEIIRIVEEMLVEIEHEAAAQEALTGEPLDLDQLYQDVQKVLYAIPQRRYGLGPEETEDLVQEAWSLFLQKRRTVSSAKSWLAGTMVNLAKQQIHSRVRAREHTREISPEVERTLGYSEDGANESTMMVRQGLGQIDERSRKLCVLIGIEGWSYEEVADELGLPIGSVGPLYIRAKNRLRKAIDTEN
ncbi:MAG: sigma-70 family RNA polymerase sigma factor [Thermoanaerobaculia bacterium]